MVPDNTTLFTINASYQSLVTLFEKMNDITSEKKDTIISGDWGKLTEIVSSQNELKIHLEKEEHTIASLGGNSISDQKISIQKNRIKQLIKQYREAETINIRLLKDSLYLAKLKANKIFKIPFDDETYSPVHTKKNEAIGRSGPIMFDQLI
ncbi:MAG: hypothetical protein A2015_07145 [Spirochaetes bacterium GWF1_31_7]|nr:MAG: hypothetical protein A2Y30_06675 [Spirochaetes bacterium GWE1_32_154]OHD52232.1 MAG: hypothetical protein A2Y29_07075 [Spirochaetes bacterium GWE2_31_10]OHD53032.1 MAG: hypothetical protein A2015_07145 [Spirochaetes bacterium GWF1_31_7]OHD80378.1 MAG: hypothetical protein A2355_05350 [Spirochaetes bacterium RIFOXYB1_FULL_32_8]HBD96180.1 hypothetical protein [Spirochaetia bacterium]